MISISNTEKLSAWFVQSFLRQWQSSDAIHGCVWGHWTSDGYLRVARAAGTIRSSLYPNNLISHPHSSEPRLQAKFESQATLHEVVHLPTTRTFSKVPLTHFHALAYLQNREKDGSKNRIYSVDWHHHHNPIATEGMGLEEMA